MNAVQEQTVWTGTEQPNHIYLMDGNNAVAYISKGSKVAMYFKKPIQIDQRGRTFVPVVPSPFKDVADANVIEVSGSKGATYFVNTADKTCTCPGYLFRGQCKHIKDLA